MSALRRLGTFYRLQLHVMRTWRPSRAAIARRVLLSFVMSFIAMTIVALLLPGVRATSLGSIAAAVVVLAIFNLLVRPLLLLAFAALSVVLVALTTIVLQVAGFLLVTALVPGYTVESWVAALVASFVYALVLATLGALLGVDDDESYWVVLVQQLAARREGVTRTDAPGLLVVQVDGLAHPILRHQVRAGRVPFIASLLRSGEMRLEAWEALLPSQTSASQAGILHGNNSFIPAFRWWEKDRGRLMVSNHPADAAEIVRRASNGEGLLSGGGASVGNLVSGDATRSYITMATIQDKSQGLGQSHAFFAFFASPSSYLEAIVRTVIEVGKEYVQAARERRRGILPRMHRGMPYPVARAGTNVLLRSLSTSLVLEEMHRGAPVIYVDYTDYDEIAHHSGPERGEALDALDGVDAVLRVLKRGMETAPRPYHLVVLSDHGQSLGATFLQRYGVSLEQVVRDLMGAGTTVRAETDTTESWGALNAFVTEASRTGGVAGAVSKVAARSEPVAEIAAAGEDEGPLPEVVVVGSGNLGLVSFPRIAHRLTLEEMDTTWPGLVEGLVAHEGVGFVMVRSTASGPLVVGKHGIRYLSEDRFIGQDPVAAYGGHAVDGLKRVDGMEHCPDILAISLLDPDTDEVAAFEELIGSHGGLGGPQTHPFILHPAAWTIDEPIIGAEAVYRQLRRWLLEIGIDLGLRSTEPVPPER